MIPQLSTVNSQLLTVDSWAFSPRRSACTLFVVPFDLGSYFVGFDDVCRIKFGQQYRFDKLEKSFAYLRSESQWLTASHVEKLFDPKNTPFAHYWPRPNLKQLDSVLRAERLKLSPVGDDPRALIQRLLAIFHNIGTVSLLLRFTYPERFGVLSTPVVAVLQVQRPRSTELYVAYCEELELWQEHFRLRSVAETEMALWTYQELLADEELAGEILGDGVDAVDSAFGDDVWVQRRRAAQVLRPFLRNYGALELARILAEESPRLAAMIAGEEYERRLRAASRRFYPASNPAGARWAYNLIDRMVQDRHVALEQRPRLNEVWEMRNAAVHSDHNSRIMLDVVAVERMIEIIESISSNWLQRGASRRH